jgi:peptidoglycan/LPS O-acetylase OafA/YrhL
MRLQGLDLLRTAAIGLVFGRHFQLALGDSFWRQADPFLNAWFGGGWVGVDLFFALSGFLIGNLLLTEWKRTQRVNARLVVGTVIFRWFSGSPDPIWRPTAIDLVFLSNYFSGLWPHTWSLAIEIHFYLLTALLAATLLSGRNSVRYFGGSLVVLVASVLVFRTCAWVIPEPAGLNLFTTFQFATHRRIDSLLIGSLLACAYGLDAIWSRISAIKPGWFLLLGMLLLSPVFLLSVDWFQSNPLGFTLVQLGASCLVIWALIRHPSSGLAPRAFAAIGRHSYCIYLFHYPLFVVWRYLHDRFGWHWVYGELAAVIFAAITMGTAISSGLEAPLLRLRERVVPFQIPPDQRGAGKN